MFDCDSIPVKTVVDVYATTTTHIALAQYRPCLSAAEQQQCAASPPVLGLAHAQTALEAATESCLKRTFSTHLFYIHACDFLYAYGRNLTAGPCFVVAVTLIGTEANYLASTSNGVTP